jgi:hypothetical protein
MEEWLMFIAKDTVTIIEAMALVEIAIGTIVAFFSGNPAMLRPSAADTAFGISGSVMRDGWLPG